MRRTLTAGPLLLHVKALAHKSRIVRTATQTSDFEMLNEPPCNSDVDPSDFLFVRFDREFGIIVDEIFPDDDELKVWTNEKA